MAKNKMLDRNKKKGGVKVRSIEDLKAIRDKRLNASYMPPVDGESASDAYLKKTGAMGESSGKDMSKKMGGKAKL